ncbi:MAG: NAD(P)-dependent oxidoreductase [Alphaproteobacteria bacterium]|nr:NAD(P)-dependent oxidoreductase [Alphaproteobacteria bacterium]
MNILLLGATGCFGTAFAAACEGRPVSLIPLSHRDIDVTDRDAVRSVIDTHKPDVVVNAVAIVDMNFCEDNPDAAFAVHGSAALAMARACAERDAVFVQTSTHAVFDGLKETPYTEDDVPNPRNVYAASKYVAERFAANLCPRHYVVRFPTLFGARRNASMGFVDKARKWLDEGRELNIADDRIDSVTYARDAADRVAGMLLGGAPFGLYHVANHGAVSYFDFICAYRDMLGLGNTIRRAKDGDFPSKGMKSVRTALSSVRGRPLRPWQDALRAYVDNGEG